MTKNPFLNALLAGVYIVFIVLVMSIFVDNPNLENSPSSILIPMTMLSLFVLSAAVMGFLFFYQPVRLYFDNERKEAVGLFLKTLASFAGITVLFILTLFFLSVTA